MGVWTDQPALQCYGGNFFDGTTTGKYGKTLNYRESIALETQKYPDTPNHDNFPSTLLNPGEEYSHVCVYRFGGKETVIRNMTKCQSLGTGILFVRYLSVILSEAKDL